MGRAVPRKKGAAKRRGRPKYDDEAILLEMAQASLTGQYPSDLALAEAFADRVEGASHNARKKRLYDQFRESREIWLRRAQGEEEQP
jgi:hypothetical protein